MTLNVSELKNLLGLYAYSTNLKMLIHSIVFLKLLAVYRARVCSWNKKEQGAIYEYRLGHFWKKWRHLIITCLKQI